MTHPRRHRSPMSTGRRNGPPARPATSRRSSHARPGPRATPSLPPVATGPGCRPAAPSRPNCTGLTVPDVVAPGARVGVDDSDLGHGLLPELVGARPSLIGTASLTALIALTATATARAGELTVRLFGGEHRAGSGACAGPTTLRTVTATGCEVALVGGRVVGDEVWVPTGSAAGRTALLLSARRAYLVVAAGDDEAAVPPDGPEWTRIAALGDFDGVVVTPAPGDPAGHRTAA